MATCTHLDSLKITQLPDTAEGCVDCLARQPLRVI